MKISSTDLAKNEASCFVYSVAEKRGCSNGEAVLEILSWAAPLMLRASSEPRDESTIQGDMDMSEEKRKELVEG